MRHQQLQRSIFQYEQLYGGKKPLSSLRKYANWLQGAGKRVIIDLTKENRKGKGRGVAARRVKTRRKTGKPFSLKHADELNQARKSILRKRRAHSIDTHNSKITNVAHLPKRTVQSLHERLLSDLHSSLIDSFAGPPRERGEPWDAWNRRTRGKRGYGHMYEKVLSQFPGKEVNRRFHMYQPCKINALLNQALSRYPMSKMTTEEYNEYIAAYEDQWRTTSNPNPTLSVRVLQRVIPDHYLQEFSKNRRRYDKVYNPLIQQARKAFKELLRELRRKQTYL